MFDQINLIISSGYTFVQLERIQLNIIVDYYYQSGHMRRKNCKVNYSFVFLL